MSNYQEIVRKARHRHRPLDSDRFMDITERNDQCDIPMVAWKPLLKNGYLQTWKGILLNKGIMEIGLYPMLIYELRPKTIIELGALNGGGAVWLADHLTLFDIPGCVISMDIDLSLLDKKAKNDSRISFLQGDCTKIAATFSSSILDSLPHPWLLIEDTHVNLVGILDHFHHHGLADGDYLIVEDTNKHHWNVWEDGWDDKEEMTQGSKKMDTLRQWLQNHHGEYLVDTYYLDMYGFYDPLTREDTEFAVV